MDTDNGESHPKIENGPNKEPEKRWNRQRIGSFSFTALAATSFVFGVLALLINIDSHWHSRHFVHHTVENWLEISFANGRFFVRSRMQSQNAENPFHLDNRIQIDSSDPSRFSQNMERQKQNFPTGIRTCLGFYSAYTHPGRTVNGREQIQYFEGPQWPAILALAFLPAFWFFNRRSLPSRMRRSASRVFVGVASVHIAIPFVLLGLLYVNSKFLGPRGEILRGITHHASMAPTRDVNGTILKLMTFNIWMGGAYKGAWKFENADRVASRIRRISELILRESPDILFLQEAVLESGPGSINQTPLIAQCAGMHAWMFGQCINDGFPFYRFIEGNAILSRWRLQPLANQKMAGDRTFYQIASDDQSTLWCSARIGAQKVLLASVHLTSAGEDISQQITQLLAFDRKTPAVLAGDFNCEPVSNEIRRIMDSNRFAAKLDGEFTVPSYAPRKTIDYIFTPPEWQLLEHRVIQTDLSDHLPVVAVYRVP